MSRPPLTTELLVAVDAYIEQHCAPHDAILDHALAAARDAGLPTIHVSPSQGKLLHVLARLVGARHILEIGTLGGYSTIWLARALPADGQLLSLEYEPLHAAVARANLQHAGLAQQVTIREGAALDLLPQIASEIVAGQRAPFDLVFIDADKQPYVEYFQWAQRMVRAGALIIADNTLRQGGVLEPAADDTNLQGIQRFNDWLAHEASGVTTVILPLVGRKGLDGITLARVDTASVDGA